MPWIFQLKQPPAVGVIIDVCVSDQEWWIIWPLICSLRSLFTILQQVTARQHFSNLQCFGSSGWPFSLRLPGGFLQYSWKALRLSFATIIAGFCHFLENLCGVSIKSVMHNLTTCLPETIEWTHSAVSEGPPEQGIRKRGLCGGWRNTNISSWSAMGCVDFAVNTYCKPLKSSSPSRKGLPYRDTVDSREAPPTFSFYTVSLWVAVWIW